MTATKTASKNGKHKAAKALPREAYDDVPRLSITLTDEATYLTRYGPRGEPAVAVPVDLDAVARAMNVFGSDTGLLPEGCLFWQSRHGRDRLGIWLPPARRTIRVDAGRARRTFKVPLPGFVFVGQGQDYAIWAAHQRPRTAGATLYQAPLPNVYGDGAICRGSVQFPVAGPATIQAAAETFFNSDFTQHLAGQLVQGEENPIKFLERLQRQRAFPLERLYHRCLLSDVLGGGRGDHA